MLDPQAEPRPQREPGETAQGCDVRHLGSRRPRDVDLEGRERDDGDAHAGSDPLVDLGLPQGVVEKHREQHHADEREETDEAKGLEVRGK